MALHTLSRYELLEEIGRGNMGVVYKARDPAMDRIVAVKVVRLGFSLDEEQRRVFLERFQREARIAGKLSHSHIVAVHDVGSGEEPFLVMEYFPGVSLAKLLEKGPLSETEVRVIAAQLGDALAYAHDQGVVHRDVKPANVLYEPGRIKLVDFGIAKLESSELTRTGEFIGTPSYMSPEIFSGGSIDGRSDLFSVGVVLYQALTGVKPFEGGSVSRTIYRVLHEDPTAPSVLRPGIDRGWDVVSKRLLAKDPTKRYANAHSLLRDLDRLSRSELLPVEDEPTVPMSAPSLRRRWLALAAPLAFLLAALALRALWPSPSEPSPSESGSRPPTAVSDPPTAFAASTPEPFTFPFVARHEHLVGHCTGDLVLSDEGVRFDTSRHGTWSWALRDIEGVRRPAADELEMEAHSPERGKRGEMTTFRFTFLRPELSLEDFQRFREHVMDPGEK